MLLNNSSMKPTFIQKLIENKAILIDFVEFSDGLIKECVKENIIFSNNEREFKTAETNEQQVTILLTDLIKKPPIYAEKFMNILTLFGYPLLINLISEDDQTYSNDLSNGLYSAIPSLHKALRKEEMKELVKYIENKIRYENVRFALKQKNEMYRKASIATRTQVEQSWKFQKEIKDKEVDTNKLIKQINEMKTELETKNTELTKVKHELEVTNKYLSKELEVAVKHNTANDKEISRQSMLIKQYKDMMEIIINNIKKCTSRKTEYYKKILENKGNRKLIVGDESYSIRQLLVLVDNFINIFDHLLNKEIQLEKLNLQVKNVITNIYGNSNTSTDLETASREFFEFMNDKIIFLEKRAKVTNDFIYGRIEEHDLPNEFKDIKLPTADRKEYEFVLNEMKQRVNTLEQQLIVKEKEAIFYRQQHSTNNVSQVIEIIPEKNSNDVEHNLQTKETLNKNSLLIPFSYKSKHVAKPTEESKYASSRIKNRNVFKPNTLKFM